MTAWGWFEDLPTKTGRPARLPNEDWKDYLDRVRENLNDEDLIRSLDNAKVLNEKRRTITDEMAKKIYAKVRGKTVALKLTFFIYRMLVIGGTRTHAESVSIPATPSSTDNTTEEPQAKKIKKTKKQQQQENVETTVKAGAAAAAGILAARQTATERGATFEDHKKHQRHTVSE